MPHDYKIFLNGHIATAWGGPTISSLKRELIKTERGCALQIRDSQHGNVGQDQMSSSKSGWEQLFGFGLKKYVEDQKGN
ncbi:MAG: hypothetical protein P8J27_11355 [Mariniblastus sp.]|nr:hypothetical protein [Mariniblastus sp.]